jgi:hypothetical protein
MAYACLANDRTARPLSMARRATLTHDAVTGLGADKLAKLVFDEASPA